MSSVKHLNANEKRSFEPLNLNYGPNEERPFNSTNTETDELGYFGNIWIRKHLFNKKGDHIEGHKHYFDHVSLLVKGSVTVQIPGEEKRTFHAPTFIAIRKDTEHAIVAEQDDTVWYCVFAIRNPMGEVIDDEQDIISAMNDPQAKLHQIGRAHV